MKLIIQIPCYNEEETLPTTLADLPTQIEGIDTIEILIINDGSADRTEEVARASGVHHIATHVRNRGLAAAFQTGINTSLQLGADIIVNTDADNQYPGHYISELVTPIVNGKADMVVGDRQTSQIQHFSPIKRFLQGFGSQVVGFVARTDVPDAPSGFRAMSRQTALQLNVFTRYTYTLETLIQASNRNLVITHIPIETNLVTRESRLMRSMSSYVFRSASTILQLFLLYQPLRSFAYMSLPFFGGGLLLWLRYAVILFTSDPERGANIQSITVGGILLLIGFLLVIFGALGEVIAFNRRLQEEILFHLKSDALQKKSTGAVHEEERTPTQQQLNQRPEESV